MHSIFEPSVIPNTDVPTYKTFNTAFVAALLAADLASLISYGIEGNGRVAFSVTDPAGLCSEQERQFQRGIFTKVNPHLLFEARAFLQSEVSRLLKPVNGGRDAKVF